MNRIDQLFQKRTDHILSIYCTAGYPELEDTGRILRQLDKSGVDLVEVGLPYSDPLADGLTIQKSSMRSLKNGMTLPLLLDQIARVRDDVSMPLILMGYFNQVLQYGEEKFVRDCVQAGIDGVILPDLPEREFERDYKTLFDKHDLKISFLVSPLTREGRIRKLSELSSAFLYVVSNSAITGAKDGLSKAQIDYFKRIEKMRLSNRTLIGFGISDHVTFSQACAYAEGAIIGSAFIRHIEQSANLEQDIEGFISSIRNKQV